MVVGAATVVGGAVVGGVVVVVGAAVVVVVGSTSSPLEMSATGMAPAMEAASVRAPPRLAVASTVRAAANSAVPGPPFDVPNCRSKPEPATATPSPAEMRRRGLLRRVLNDRTLPSGK